MRPSLSPAPLLQAPPAAAQQLNGSTPHISAQSGNASLPHSSSPSSSTSSAPASAASSSGSSLFTAKLHRELLKMPDAAWRVAFIDYQRLRKQIKKIVYYELEGNSTHKPTTNPPPPSSSTLTTSSTQAPDVSSSPFAVSASSSAAAASPLPAPSGSSSPPPPLLPAQSSSASSSSPLPPTVPSPLSLPSSSAQRDRLRKSRDVFWCVLKAEIDKVNAFFTVKEEEANRQFRAIAMDGPEEPRLPSALDTDRLIFAKLLLTQHPRPLAERLLPPALLHLAATVDWATFPPARVSRVAAFLSLCGVVDQLRKFVVINYVVVLKVLKKYQEYTHRNAKEEFAREVDTEPFLTSARLAALLQRAEAITFRLLYTSDAAAPGASSADLAPPMDSSHTVIVKTEPQSSSSPAPPVPAPSSSSSSSTSSPSAPCPICHHALSNPVQLQCDHRCCFACLAQTVTVARSFACPVCSAQQEFDSLDLGLESVLTKFAGVSLTDREKMEGDSATAHNHSTTPPASAPPARNDKQPTADSGLQMQSATDLPPLQDAAALKVDAKVKSEGEPMDGSEQPPQQPLSPSSLHRHLLLQTQSMAFDLPAKDEGGDGESSGDEDTDSDGDDAGDSVHPSSSHKRAAGGEGNEHRKFGRGSCHQCKTTRDSKLLLCCTSKAEKGKRKRKCRKKYCAACLTRTYAQVMSAMTPADISRWQCPACVGICTCAACQRRGKETALENVGLPPSSQHPR